MRTGAPGRWSTARLPPRELLELQRALDELHAHHEGGTARLRAEIERLEVTLDSITEGILVTTAAAASSWPTGPCGISTA